MPRELCIVEPPPERGHSIITLLSLAQFQGTLSTPLKEHSYPGSHVDQQVKERLLASIEANRLVILIGAGLSMAPPSQLPSAAAVAADCFDRYTAGANPNLDPALRENLEALAEYFFARNTLETVFISRLVPWQRFVRPPNAGHAALADFLTTRVVAAALSSNYDILVEQAAWNYGARLTGALDGDEANVHAASHSPLLKFHGCAIRDPKATVWTKLQLNQGALSDRIEKSRTWMQSILREKDLLVVGFWSDWSYLNEILGNALSNVSPLSVTLVDPSTSADLEAKAPALWTLAHKPGVTFSHVQASGHTVLDELRRAFSLRFLRLVLRAGVAPLQSETEAPCQPEWLEPPDLDAESLYDLRRDAEGVPAGSPATRREPDNNELLGFFHLLLRRAGATPVAGGYEIKGQRVRVLNGAGQILSRLRDRFQEAPVLNSANVVAAIGATDLATPGNVVRSGRSGDIIRPAAQARWVDFRDARQLLDV